MLTGPIPDEVTGPTMVRTDILLEMNNLLSTLLKLAVPKNSGLCVGDLCIEVE